MTKQRERFSRSKSTLSGSRGQTVLLPARTPCICQLKAGWNARDGVKPKVNPLGSHGMSNIDIDISSPNSVPPVKSIGHRDQA